VHVWAASLLTGAIWVGIAMKAPEMYPLHHDTSADFWYRVTGVNLTGEVHALTNWEWAVFDDDRFVCSGESGMSGSWDLPDMTITEAELAEDFPRVVSAMAKQASGKMGPYDDAAIGYIRWNGAPRSSHEIRDFVLSIQEARRDGIARRTMGRSTYYE